MLYVIYNIPDDIDRLVTDSLTDALLEAGYILDNLDPTCYEIYSIDMTEVEYEKNNYIDETVGKRYTVKEFIDKVSMFDQEPKRYRWWSVKDIITWTDPNSSQYCKPYRMIY